MPKLISNTPIIKTDAYKIGHIHLYSKGLTKIYSTLTPRNHEYFPWSDNMVAFGYQMFVIKELINDWNENFFKQDIDDIVYTYQTVVGSILGKDNANADHVKALHKLGYLPIEVKALPEGTLVPMKVPVLTIENTDPNFPWLPNFLETILLSDTFVTSTVATISHKFRQIGKKYLEKTSDNLDALDFQFHDFSERGQHGNEASILSGVGHLASFKGSDTLQATVAVHNYYGEDLSKDITGSISASVLATEHSVMEELSAKYEDDTTDKDLHHQYEVYKTLIENNPNGILSVVSDTYDYYAVINEVLPKLKKEIMARNGKLMVRPDDGDKYVIIPDTLNSLWDTFGGTVNSKGYKVLDSHVGIIYGEGTTLDNVEKLLDTVVNAGFSTENLVIGVGAYVYSVLVGRDSFSQAIKAQLSVVNGKEHLMYKDPKTDTKHLKKSLKGAVAVVKESNGTLKAIDGLTLEEANDYKGNLLHTIFEDGKAKNEVTFTEIRNKLNKDLD